MPDNIQFAPLHRMMTNHRYPTCRVSAFYR